jgi:hypothetical protein
MIGLEDVPTGSNPLSEGETRENARGPACAAAALVVLTRRNAQTRSIWYRELARQRGSMRAHAGMRALQFIYAPCADR